MDQDEIAPLRAAFIRAIGARGRPWADSVALKYGGASQGGRTDLYRVESSKREQMIAELSGLSTVTARASRVPRTLGDLYEKAFAKFNAPGQRSRSAS